jgi:hypothetical protein
MRWWGRVVQSKTAKLDEWFCLGPRVLCDVKYSVETYVEVCFRGNAVHVGVLS